MSLWFWKQEPGDDTKAVGAPENIEGPRGVQSTLIRDSFAVKLFSFLVNLVWSPQPIHSIPHISRALAKDVRCEQLSLKETLWLPWLGMLLARLILPPFVVSCTRNLRPGHPAMSTKYFSEYKYCARSSFFLCGWHTTKRSEARYPFLCLLRIPHIFVLIAGEASYCQFGELCRTISHKRIASRPSKYSVVYTLELNFIFIHPDLADKVTSAFCGTTITFEVE